MPWQGVNDLTNMRYGNFSTTGMAFPTGMQELRGGLFGRLAASTVPGGAYTVRFRWGMRTSGTGIQNITYLTNLQAELTNGDPNGDILANQPIALTTEIIPLPLPNGLDSIQVPGAANINTICGSVAPNVTWHQTTASFTATTSSQYVGLDFTFHVLSLGNYQGAWVYLDDIEFLGPSPEEPCPLDIDLNGVYNGADIETLCGLVDTEVSCANNNLHLADIDADSDGTITYQDIAQFLSNNCGACEPAVDGLVVEPTAPSPEIPVEKSNLEPSDGTQDMGLFLQPNPTNGKFRLSAPLTDELVRRLTVYDAQGKIVLTMAPIQGEIPTIDLEGSPNGPYMVTVQDGEMMSSLRLVKE